MQRINEDRYYKESGHKNDGKILGVILVEIVAIAGLGWGYGYVSYYIPFFGFLIAALYASLAGYSLYLSIRLFKIRNQKYTSRLSLVLGVVTIYSSWFWFIYIDQGEFIWSPVGWAQVVVEHEIWWGAYVAWILEAGLFMVAMWFSVTGEIVEPFCESCNKWLKETSTVKHLEPVDENQLVAEVEKHNYGYLLNLKKVDPVYHNQTKVKLYSCKTCGEENYLTVEKIQVVIEKNGKPTENLSQTIVGNLIVKPKDMETLVSWAQSYSVKSH